MAQTMGRKQNFGWFGGNFGPIVVKSGGHIHKKAPHRNAGLFQKRRLYLLITWILIHFFRI